MPKFCVLNISGFINRDVHPQNFHLSISIVKNIHFIVYPINCYIFANEKSYLTSKHMHIAEIRTVAKLLPLLR